VLAPFERRTAVRLVDRDAEVIAIQAPRDLASVALKKIPPIPVTFSMKLSPIST